MGDSRSNVVTSLEPWLELNDKVVMVTGASSGLGRVFCLDLAKAGCRIVAAARRIDRLESLCRGINSGVGSTSSVEPSQSQTRAVAVELDLGASGPAIQASVKKAWDAFGRIDALINNAGVRGSIHNPLDLTEGEWDDIVRTNLTGTWLVSKYVCSFMRDAQRGGSVINISSIAGLDRGQLPGGLAYGASKVAVITMTKVITNSISSLNPSDVLKLLQSLVSIIQLRGAVLACALPWLKSLLLQHAGSIMSQGSSVAALNSLYQLIESRISNFNGALQLSTCLDLLYTESIDDGDEENNRIVPVISEDESEDESADSMEVEGVEDGAEAQVYSDISDDEVK